MAQASRFGRPPQERNPKLDLGAFAAWGYDERGWSRQTREQYPQVIAQADRWLHEHRHRSIRRASRDDLKAWLFAAHENAQTRNRRRAVLTAYFDYLISTGVRANNPATELPKIRRPETLPRALPAEQIRYLLVMSEGFPIRTRALIHLLAFGGLRISEAGNLRWEDLDLTDSWMRFTGKGQKARTVPIHPTLLPVLRSWRVQCPSKVHLFPNMRDSNAGPMSRRRLWQLVREVGEAADIQVSPHVFRHSAATRMLEKGADVRLVQEYLGHASLETTQRYTRVVPERLKNAVNEMGY
jgi:site-specific recombinase XerD